VNIIKTLEACKVPKEWSLRYIRILTFLYLSFSWMFLWIGKNVRSWRLGDLAIFLSQGVGKKTPKDAWIYPSVFCCLSFIYRHWIYGLQLCAFLLAFRSVFPRSPHHFSLHALFLTKIWSRLNYLLCRLLFRHVVLFLGAETVFDWPLFTI
jgi:hypothetical protein